MRNLIKALVKTIAETVPIIEPIYEFGALQTPLQVGYADMRPFFPGKEYVGCDIQQGPGVDRLIDLHHTDLPSESVGLVLILETLEHIEFPWQAIEEAYRILKPGGCIVITSTMNFHIHNYPADYWRFTPAGFSSLMRQFHSALITSVGQEDFPHAIVGVGFKGEPPSEIGILKHRIREWKLCWSGSWESWARLLSPPLILSLYRRIWQNGWCLPRDMRSGMYR